MDPHRSREAANHDLPVYPSITLAASEHRLDFVDICAPPASHAPLVLEALHLNLHAIVEKPLVLTTDDFDAVARIAPARSCIVLPVHNWRYAPALQQASGALRRGEIGALRSAEIDVWRPAACGSADSPAWRQNRAVAGGGIVLDHGWHAFYLMMEWFGGRPDTVDGWCHAEPPQDVETDADITLGFAGRTGVIRLTWRGPRRRNRVLLTGDAGSIEIDDDLYVIKNARGEERSRTASLSQGSYHPEWFPQVLTEFERALGDRAAAARALDEAGACVQIADRIYNALRLRSGQAKTAVAGRSWIATILVFCLWVVLPHPLAAQIDPRTALLERAGFDALNRGQARVAAETFREAIAADPKNAMLHLGAAMAAVLERRDRDAKDELERALALDKTLTGARVLLGQVQYRMGDRTGAMRTYETVVAEVPDNAEAQATLARWRREAELHDRMQQAVGSHFTVSFEGPAEAALAAAALESLDKAYWRIGELLGTYPSDPIGVVLYTTEQFRDVTQSPTWAAGAYRRHDSRADARRAGIGAEQLADAPVRFVERLERRRSERGLGGTFKRHGEMRSDGLLHAIVQLGLAAPARQRGLRIGVVGRLGDHGCRRSASRPCGRPSGPAPVPAARVPREGLVQRERAFELVFRVAVPALQHRGHRRAKMKHRVLRVRGNGFAEGLGSQCAPDRGSAHRIPHVRAGRCVDRSAPRGDAEWPPTDRTPESWRCRIVRLRAVLACPERRRRALCDPSAAMCTHAQASSRARAAAGCAIAECSLELRQHLWKPVRVIRALRQRRSPAALLATRILHTIQIVVDFNRIPHSLSGRTRFLRRGPRHVESNHAIAPTAKPNVMSASVSTSCGGSA